MSPLANSDKPLECRRCGAVHDDATGLSDDVLTAGPGDVVLCIECATVGVIPEGGAPFPGGPWPTRQPTANEYDELLRDPHFTAGLAALHSFLRKRGAA